MMKRIFALLLFLALLAAGAGLAEEAHEHTWGEWTPAEGGHTAVCASCGEALTAKHYTFATRLGSFSDSVCGMCGQYSGGVFPLIEGASIASTKEKPSKQRGEFIARGMEKPFSDENVLFAFTVAYANNGGLATWKDMSVITLPLPLTLPDTYRLIRVQPSAGDDSVQNPEKWIDLQSTWENGALTFTAKTPALYLLVAE